jgi:hypothetical protein
MTFEEDSGELTGKKAVPRHTSGKPVQIRYGIHRMESRVAGKTVGEIRKLLGQPLNLDPGATALVNHRQVTDREILRGGELLEFVRPAGVKG